MSAEAADEGLWAKHGQMLYTTIIAPVIAGVLLMVVQYHSPYFEKQSEKPGEKDAEKAERVPAKGVETEKSPAPVPPRLPFPFAPPGGSPPACR